MALETWFQAARPWEQRPQPLADAQRVCRPTAYATSHIEVFGGTKELHMALAVLKRGLKRCRKGSEKDLEACFEGLDTEKVRVSPAFPGAPLDRHGLEIAQLSHLTAQRGPQGLAKAAEREAAL